MRKAGISKIILYRTNEFDIYCRGFAKDTEPSLRDVVMPWERLYGPQLEQLEIRMIQNARDFTGASDLLQAHVAKKLDVQESSWNDAFNEWRFNEEAATFGLVCKPTVALDDP